MAKDSPTKILDYGHSADDATRRQTVSALLLCSPGFFCWMLFACGSFRIDLSHEKYMLIYPAWLVAIITAIVSIDLYLYRRTSNISRWYILLNLTVNIPGLLLTIYLIVFTRIL